MGARDGCVVPHIPSWPARGGSREKRRGYPSCSRYSLIALAAMANARLATGTPA
jgi:hypothetical protein